MSPARDQFARTTTRFCTRSVAYRCGRSACPPNPKNRPWQAIPRRPPTIRQSGYVGKEHNDAASVASEVTSYSFDNDSRIDIVGERLRLLVRLRSLLGSLTSALPIVPFSPVCAESQIRTLVMRAADYPQSGHARGHLETLVRSQ